MNRQNNAIFRISARPFIAVLLLAVLSYAQDSTSVLDSAKISDTINAQDSTSVQNSTDTQNSTTSQETLVSPDSTSSQEVLVSSDSASVQDSTNPLEAKSTPDSLFIDFDTALDVIIANNIDIQEAKYNWMMQNEAAIGSYGEFEPHLTARAFKEKGDAPNTLFSEIKEEYKIGIQGLRRNKRQTKKKHQSFHARLNGLLLYGENRGGARRKKRA
ncbi:MAG: hypothetical protein IIT53_15065, partial [Fibrobacter sp.]|nr:hypothetical protein [Fibrobacter sp.]